MSVTWDPVSQAVIAALQPVIAFLTSLAYLGKATHFINLPALDLALQPTASALAMDVTLLKYTLSLFLVYPFAAVLYFLPNKNAKHFFSFITGFLMVQWIFGPDWIHTFASSLGTYLICMFAPRQQAAKIAFLFAMGYMTMAHIYSMYTSYLSSIFDFTGTQMVLTMKLTSFAYNVHDGMADYANVFEKKHDDRVQKVYSSRRTYAITKMPNLLEFFGYIYCFTCILAGPAFEYQDYARSIDLSSFQIKEHDKISTKKPNTILPGLQRLLVGVACMVGYLQIGGRFPLSNHFKPEFNASHPFFIRVGILLVAMLGERFKYYFAWKIAEGASIMAGFGFEGYKQEGSEHVAIGWKGVENIDIIGFETATTSQLASRAWNKRTQGWLERYTYQRTNRSLYMTYFVSAIWHGLYPGFFFVFFTIAFITEVERLIKTKLNPLIIPGYKGSPGEAMPAGMLAKVYWLACWVIFVLTLNYTAQVFSMGSLERSYEAYKASMFYGHVAMFVAYVLLTVMPSKKEKKDPSKKA